MAKNPISSTYPNSINSLCDTNPKCIIKINEKCIKNNDLTKFELLANMAGSNNYGGIYALAILSNDLIASGSGDTTIKVWNSTTFQLVATLKGHTNYVFSLAVLLNGNLVSGGWDTMIKVWKSTTFELITNLEEGNTGSVSSLAINMLNENIISTGSYDNSIKIWNSKSFQLVTNLKGHTNQVRSVVILPSNGNIVSGSMDTTIKVCDSITYQLITTLSGHNDWILSLAVQPKNENIISVSYGETIKIWNSITFQLVATLEGKNSNNLMVGRNILLNKSLAFLLNGNMVTGLSDGIINVRDSSKFQLVTNVKGHSTFVTSLAILSNGNLVSASMDNEIKIWKLI